MSIRTETGMSTEEGAIPAEIAALTLAAVRECQGRGGEAEDPAGRLSAAKREGLVAACRCVCFRCEAADNPAASEWWALPVATHRDGRGGIGPCGRIRTLIADLDAAT